MYSFQPEKKAWEKTAVDGPFFVYQRCDKPYYSLFIANRQSPSDFIEPLIERMETQGNGQYLYTNNGTPGKLLFCKFNHTKHLGGIKCIWFYRQEEREAITELVNKLIANLKDGKVSELI